MKLKRIARHNKAIIIVIVLIFTLLGLYNVVYLPKAKTMALLHRELESILKDIDKAEGRIKSIPDIKRESALLREKLILLERQVPDEGKIPYVIQELARKTQDLDINVISINPWSIKKGKLKGKKETVSSAIEKVYIEINIQCSYQVIARYIKALGNLPILLTVEDVTIQSNKELSPDLEVHLVVATYILKVKV